jgi:hypothetical protein
MASPCAPDPFCRGSNGYLSDLGTKRCSAWKIETSRLGLEIAAGNHLRGTPVCTPSALDSITVMKTKVFGIGFHKTATTSLAKALSYLGYRVTGPNWVDNPNIGEEVHEMAFDLVSRFDAFQDNPWPILYKELDGKFPGSKFILTLRPSEEWIRSVVNHFNEKETPMREWIYGIARPKGNEDIYIARYERHNREVLEYFKNRSEQLLVLNITKSDGWEKLCPFLGKPIPAIGFPCANTASQREELRKRESSWAWRTYRKLRRRAKWLITVR